MGAAFYWGVTRFCKHTVVHVYTRMHSSGQENIPKTGAFVMVSNHLNDGDPGLIATQSTRRIAYLAKDGLFKIPLFKHFMVAYGAVPVRRGEADLKALRLAQAELDAGVAIGVFPEGTRSGRNAAMTEAYPGAALFALRSGAPVLPVAITGTQLLSMPFVFFRPFWKRPKVDIRFGEPFYLEKPARINNESVKAATDLIMRRVAALLPESYRGYYGSAPHDGGPVEAPSGAGDK